MAVPDFQTLMRPVLDIAADGQPHSTTEILKAVVDQFDLSEEDRNELLPSGKAKRLNNRVGWALTHLRHAGLVANVKRGVIRITAEGQTFLEAHDGPVRLKDLDSIQRHHDWFHASRESSEPKSNDSGPPIDTPEEQIEALVEGLTQQLTEDLLERIRGVDAYRFESIVVDLLLALGYGGSRKEAAQVTKKSGDEGIDGVINEDRLGLDVVYVQAKRWKDGNVVGRKEIQAFVGALAGKQANKGVFITSSTFSAEAHAYASTVVQRVILIDGRRLASLMIEHGMGVTPVHTFQLHRIDADYFEDE